MHKTLEITLKNILPFVPSYLSNILLNWHPGIIRLMPKNREYQYSNYLGKFIVNIKGIYYIEVGMATSSYEPYTSRIIHDFVKKGFTCFDVGANVGAISLMLLDCVGEKGKIHSFEPGKRTFQRLNKNMLLNKPHTKSVVLNNFGLSNKKEVLLLREPEYNKGNATTLDILDGKGEKIVLTTLDRYVKDNNIKKLNFLKIDVEGMEFEVLKGSLESIRRFKPIILFETLKVFDNHRGRDLFIRIEELLKKDSYQLYFYSKEKKLVKVSYPNLPDDTLAFHNQFRKNNTALFD